MKGITIQVVKPTTLQALLAEYELLDTVKELVVAVNGAQEKKLSRVLTSADEVRIYPVISGGSDDSSFCTSEYKGRIEIGNSWTPVEEEILARKDRLAVKLSRRLFIGELEKYAKPGYDIEALLSSNRCANCKKELHIPDAWQHLSLSMKKKYFKALVILEQTEIILCCRCYLDIKRNDD